MSRSVSDSERAYKQVCVKMVELYAVEPGYIDTGLYDTSSIATNILRYQLIPHREP
jgi:mannitol/fructose-specific phosphotransferase system IIA component (Ntr-type)